MDRSLAETNPFNIHFRKVAEKARVAARLCETGRTNNNFSPHALAHIGRSLVRMQFLTGILFKPTRYASDLPDTEHLINY